MKKIFKSQKSTIILLGAIILGGILGLIFKEDISVLKPFGDLFINLLLVIIVPLIFLTISTAIGKMKQPKRIGKILTSIVVVFIFTSLISVFVGLISTNVTKLVSSGDSDKIIEVMDLESIDNSNEEINFLSKTINTISTNDFSNLLSLQNMIALVVFSILIGVSINLSKEKGKPFLEVLKSANHVVQKFIKIIMYYAPIGLGCYFANLVGTLGKDIAIGYAKTFILYTITAIIFYFVVYSIYAFIAGGKKGFNNYWKNIIPATITALATCSSSASIPINTTQTKKMGVSKDIADTTIPLGCSFHKDGSIIGSVFKIMFLVYLFNSTIAPGKILIVALLATLLVVAVPIGGGTISETLIITSLGFPIGALPILTIIATIIDAPATVLNVVGDSASSMLISRIVDGKNWIKK